MSINPYAAPAPSADLDPPLQARGEPTLQALEEWVRRYRLLALLVIFGAAFADGFAITTGSSADVLAVLVLTSAITLWCGLDARLHGKLFLRSFAWILMFTWPVGVAVHLVWTRGATGLLTYALAAFSCIGAAVAGGVVAGLVLSL